MMLLFHIWSFDVKTARRAAAQPPGGCGGSGRQVLRQSGGIGGRFGGFIDFRGSAQALLELCSSSA